MNDASLALAARIVLAVVLAVSATSKLRSRVVVSQQMGRLVGDRLAPLISRLLPVAELAVALALVVWWSPVPGVVAIALLGVFTVVLVRAQARHVPCLCFGASALDAPVGPAAIVRNGALAALAVFAIGSPTGARAIWTIVALGALGAAATVAVRASR